MKIPDLRADADTFLVFRGFFELCRLRVRRNTNEGCLRLRLLADKSRTQRY